MKHITNCLLIFLCTAFVTKCNAQNADINLLQSINQNGSSFKNNFSKAITQSSYPITIAAPATTFLVGYFKHDEQLKKKGLYMTGAVIASAAGTEILKYLVKRERPYSKYPTIIIQRETSDGYSFPSGHATMAFCTATTLSLNFPKWYVIVPSYLWAAGVGYARMYQGVHYPTDILGSMIIGSGCGWLSYKMEKWMNKKNAVSKMPN